MIRSSVDLPQPDGPMSETNSPAATDRSMPTSASTRPAAWPRGAKTFETPAISTTGRRRRMPGQPGVTAPCGAAVRAAARGGGRSASTPTTSRYTADPEDRRHDDGGPQVFGVQRVVLHAGDDLAGEAVLDERRQLPDDRADDRRRCGDPEPGEQVRPRGRQAELAQDRASATPRTSASARAPAGRRRAGRAGRRSSPGRTSGRSTTIATPNQSALRPMTMSGAMAMIGIVWLATMSGTSARSSMPHVDEDDRQAEPERRPEGEPDGGVAEREQRRPDEPFERRCRPPRRGRRTPPRCPRCAAA